MTDRTKSGEHPPSILHLRDAATQRLDGPDALLTAEWDVKGMFWPGATDDESNDVTDLGAGPAAAVAAESGQRVVITRPKPTRPAPCWRRLRPSSWLPI